MAWTGTTRRIVVGTFLFLALAASAVGWAEETSTSLRVDSAVTLARPPGLAIDATLTSRPEVLTAAWAEQRLAKARPSLGLAVLVGVSLLLAAAAVTLKRPSPAPLTTLWRRRSVGLRAPPLLRVS